MKKTMVAVMMVVFAAGAMAADGSKLAVKNSAKNKGLDKQLTVMEKTLYSKGVDAAGVMEAKMICAQLCEKGLTPKEARSLVEGEVKECLKQGVKGSELADKLQTMTQAKLQDKLQAKEEAQLKTQTRTQQRLRDQAGTCEETKEMTRTGMPDGKGLASGTGTGAGAGDGTGTGTGGNAPQDPRRGK